VFTKIRWRILLTALLLGMAAVVTIAGVSQRKHNHVPANGYVPDEATAIRIAEAIWIPIYGGQQIENEKPFHAKLNRGVWTVEGSLPAGMDGGVAVAEISKSDGRIIRVSHGK
jgi:hypothetical protein